MIDILLGILLGLIAAVLVVIVALFIAFIISRQKLVKTMDEIEKFIDTKHTGTTTGGTAAFIMPDRVGEISRSKPGVSIDEVLI